MLDRNNYRTGNIIITDWETLTNPARVRHLDSLSQGMQTATHFDRQSSQVCWQTDGSQTQTQGPVRDRARQIQRDHIHTADKIITVAGGERGVEGGEKTARAIVRTRREKKQSHRPDQRKSWFLAQLWVLPLTHPPQPWVLEADKEREKERGGGEGGGDRKRGSIVNSRWYLTRSWADASPTSVSTTPHW